MSVFADILSGRVSARDEELLWRNVYPDLAEGGTHVSERNAMTISDVFKCVRVKAETIACLPKKVFERATIVGREGRRPSPSHPLYPIIHDRPNPLQTSFRFFEMGIAHLNTWGNWYSYIERGRTGRVRALWPILPHNVRFESRRPSDPQDIRFWYMVTDPVTGKEERFFPDEILHVPFLGYDGIQGYSPVRMMMDTLGWAKSTKKTSAAFFQNGARMSGLLVAPQTLTPEQKTQLKESFAAFGKGADSAGRVGLIEGQLTWQQLSMPNDEAQFLDTMKFQRTEVCGMYRMPPHKIADLERSTNNNIEHQSIEFASDTIQPDVERCEQEFERALFTVEERSRFFIEFDFKVLMRGDIAARTTHYREMINVGNYSQNDCLEKENMPPFEGGDEHWMQLNMAPISQLRKLASMPTDTGASPTDQQIQQRITAELQERTRASYLPIFRDAVGRVIARKAADRERYAPGAFRHLLHALNSIYSGAAVIDMERSRAKKRLADAGGQPTDDEAAAMDGAMSRLAAAEESFIGDYIGALSKRSVDWMADQADAISIEELNRAVEALAGRK